VVWEAEPLKVPWLEFRCSRAP